MHLQWLSYIFFDTYTHSTQVILLNMLVNCCHILSYLWTRPHEVTNPCHQYFCLILYYLSVNSYITAVNYALVCHLVVAIIYIIVIICVFITLFVMDFFPPPELCLLPLNIKITNTITCNTHLWINIWNSKILNKSITFTHITNLQESVYFRSTIRAIRCSTI